MSNEINLPSALPAPLFIHVVGTTSDVGEAADLKAVREIKTNSKSSGPLHPWIRRPLPVNSSWC